jgi:hypothetical protein
VTTIIGWFENGTDGKLDGDLISANDAGTNPFPFLALNTKYKTHYRTIDSVTGGDPGEDSTENIAPPLPTGFVACFTENGTYSATPTTDATTVVGANRPLWVQQTERVEEGGDYDITFADFTPVAGTEEGGFFSRMRNMFE